jgi:hypothetical protein
MILKTLICAETSSGPCRLENDKYYSNASGQRDSNVVRKPADHPVQERERVICDD